MSARNRGASSPTTLVAAFVGCSMLAGVLGAGLAIPAVGAVGKATESGIRVFDQLPADFDMTPPSQTTTLLYADGSPMATYFFQNRISVPLSQVSPFMKQAMLAVEDARFYDHPGVDAEGIARALVKNAFGSKEGASTLTQQWVKNVLLDQAAERGDQDQIEALRTADKIRKIKEIKFALAAEKKLSKDQILENYLNIANFSGGAYGIEAASKRWFSKSAKDLTLAEAAQLAGTVQRPTFYHPERRPEEVLKRRQVVLSRMLSLGWITQKQYDEAAYIKMDQLLKPTRTPNGCAESGSAGYFCQYVTKVILNDKTFGATRPERARLLNRGGLTITTTLERGAQDIAGEEAMQTAPPENSSPDIGVAMVMVEPGTGKIKAMAQNRRFVGGKSDDPAETNLNFAVDEPHGGGKGFQPGSNFKPFILAEWLKQGYSPDDMVNASPRTFGKKMFTVCGEPYDGQDWPVGTASKSIRGPITVAKATQFSINPAYAEMETKLDLCEVRKTAESLGVRLAAPRHKDVRPGDSKYQLSPIPSMVLGSDSLAPITVAGAYAAFAADGVFCKPIAMTRVTTSDGKELPVPDAGCNQALPKNVALTMQQVMSGVWQGTAKYSDPKPTHPAAGKTGTTNGDKDTWFSGYTKQIAGSVWVGHISGQKTLDGKTFNGVTKGKVYGGTIAAPAWLRFVNRYSEKLEKKPFELPEGAQPQPGEEGGVPNVWGMPIEQAQSTLEAAGYKVEVGGRIFSKAPVGACAGSSPRKNVQLEEGGTVKIYVSKGPAKQAPAPAPTPPKPAVTATAKPAAPKATPVPKRTTPARATARPRPIATAKPKKTAAPPPARPAPPADNG